MLGGGHCRGLPGLIASFGNASSCARRWLSSSGTGVDDNIRWVFMGAPGVGKGTYASRASKHFGVAHIATGDLIRAEMKAGSALGTKIFNMVNEGRLVPDDVIMELLLRRLEEGHASGERGYILDGYPRTPVQAQKLLSEQPIQVAFNLGLREEVLVEKCLGRRLCRHCGKNYNLANIRLPASDGKPEIVMPPLNPPPDCAPHLERRDDDTEEVIRRRLQIYWQQAGPVEDFFKQAGLLHNFEITAGIPETLPSLLQTLQRFMPRP